MCLCFRDPNRVPRIENRVPGIRENYHRVSKIMKIGSLESVKSCPYRTIPAPDIFLRKTLLKARMW